MAIVTTYARIEAMFKAELDKAEEFINNALLTRDWDEHLQYSLPTGIRYELKMTLDYPVLFSVFPLLQLLVIKAGYQLVALDDCRKLVITQTVIVHTEQA